MAFVTTLHLQASADVALSCKPEKPVTRGGHGSMHHPTSLFVNWVHESCANYADFFKDCES